MPTSVEFVGGRWNEFDRDAVKFPVIIDGRNIWCFVSQEALSTDGMVDRHPDDWLRIFDIHEEQILSVARKKILASPNEGEYLVVSTDFRP